MSNKRKRTASLDNVRHLPAASRGLPARPELPEIAGNVRDIVILSQSTGVRPAPPPKHQEEQHELARLRNIVDTLKCKYATELAVYRARPLALELCDQMADVVTPGRPGPPPPARITPSASSGDSTKGPPRQVPTWASTTTCRAASTSFSPQ